MKKIYSILLAGLLTLTLVVPAYGEHQGEADIESGQEIVPVYKLEQELQKAADFAPENPLPVKSAILIEQQSGKVLYEQNADQPLPPASVTKIMTLLLVMEALENGSISLNDKVTCSDTAAAYGGSQIWLEPGEQMTVDELLRATAIASANDAAVALGEHLAGSELAFVQQMNERAAQLGMQNTTFKCAAGLDNEGHLTTARDIAIMSRQLMTHKKIQDYTTTWMDSLRGGATQLVNTNRMVRFYQGATGLKTGTTSGAGSCLSATAQRDGLGLVAVVMGADTSDNRFAAARGMLDWGFANYQCIQIAPPPLDPLGVTGGVAPDVVLDCVPPAGVVIPRGQAQLLDQKITLPERLEAPVAQGQEVGKVEIFSGNEKLMEYPVIAATQVQKMTFGRALGSLCSKLLRAA